MALKRIHKVSGWRNVTSTSRRRVAAAAAPPAGNTPRRQKRILKSFIRRNKRVVDAWTSQLIVPPSQLVTS